MSVGYGEQSFLDTPSFTETFGETRVKMNGYGIFVSDSLALVEIPFDQMDEVLAFIQAHKQELVRAEREEDKVENNQRSDEGCRCN